MNYEELYDELNSIQKKVKDAVGAAGKSYKTIIKDMESGDIKDLKKTIAVLEDNLTAAGEALETLKNAAEGFNTEEYFQSGDFTSQLLAECGKMNIDVNGEAPVFEMFPYKVKVDAENQDVYIDRKKYASVRPSSVAVTIKAGQDRLNKANFNPTVFANELAEAYDMACIKLDKQPGANLMLLNLYKFMVPMSRCRKEYDQQAFAFDLARLYAKNITGEVTTIKDGRYFQFGPARDIKKAIRILDAEGREQYLSTICFFE